MPHQPEPGDVLISLTNGEDGRQRRAINLRIENELSGKDVIDVDLTGEQFAAILGNKVTRASGARLPKSATDEAVNAVRVLRYWLVESGIGNRLIVGEAEELGDRFDRIEQLLTKES